MEKPWETDLTVYEDEALLLEGLRRRDRDACTCLLKRYAPRLHRLTLTMLGNTGDADDALQESFIRACREIERFEGRSSLGTWLHRITVNSALASLRRRRPDAFGLPDETTSAPPELIDASEPALHSLNQELHGRLEAAIMQLPPALRAAFVLRDLEGLSTQEAASALDISESALKVRLHRARLALRAALAPYFSDPDATKEPANDSYTVD